ncbi:HTH domain-containing protein [Enterococcus dongliensis]|uniref:HTH domain-containing protein n=1 Tax=Enterococcus dongliensis TaxID=2559925 RepID=UPI002897BE24|nr:HTH domain-containing protein [Enterococcus dongliensis]
MFTTRQLMIIQIMIKENYYITGEKIAKKMNLSIKTVQKEIKYIKSRLKDYQISVISQKGKGYLLKMESKTQSDIFLNSISYFSKTAIQENYDREFILLSIIQKVVILKEKINISYFEEKMFVGKKYIRNLLDELKELVKDYELTLYLRQGKGIYLKGSIFHIQMLYMDLLEKVDNRFLYGEQFLSRNNDYEMHLLIQYFWRNNILIPYVKVKKLCLFLYIQKFFMSEVKEKTNISYNRFERALLNCELRKSSEQICAFFEISPSENFVLNLTKMLLCFFEKKQLQKYDLVIQEIYYINRQDMLRMVMASLKSGKDIFRISIEELSNIITDILLVNIIEQKMCITNDFGNINNLGGKTMLCEYIAADILDMINNRFGICFSLDVLSNIKLVLRSYTVKFSEISTQKIYVISKQDYTVGEYIAKNLEHEFLKLVDGIYALSTLQSFILPTDIIVTDIPIENFSTYQNVLYFTSLFNYQEVRTSVENYVSLASDKSRLFFEKLELNSIDENHYHEDYIEELLSINILKKYDSQITRLDQLHEQYQIFVENSIAVLVFVDLDNEISIQPIWHKNSYKWHDMEVNLTLIVRLKRLADFIIFDTPIFILLNNSDISSFIKGHKVTSEDFEEKLLETIY